jgi:hypothetical protein
MFSVCKRRVDIFYPRTTSTFTLPTLRSEGFSLTLRNRHFWFGGRSGPVGSKVAGTSTILEYVPASGWVAWPENMTGPASYPLVIPYNI